MAFAERDPRTKKLTGRWAVALYFTSGRRISRKASSWPARRSSSPKASGAVADRGSF